MGKNLEDKHMSIDQASYDERCLRALYEIQKEQGAIPYMTYDEYKELFTERHPRLENPFEGLSYRG